jgi:hypothetical protein
MAEFTLFLPNYRNVHLPPLMLLWVSYPPRSSDGTIFPLDQTSLFIWLNFHYSFVTTEMYTRRLLCSSGSVTRHVLLLAPYFLWTKIHSLYFSAHCPTSLARSVGRVGSSPTLGYQLFEFINCWNKTSKQ